MSSEVCQETFSASSASSKFQSQTFADVRHEYKDPCKVFR